MRKLMLTCLLLAGCGGTEPEAGNQAAAPAKPASAGAPKPDGTAAESLTGLYEGGGADPANQLCMVGKGPGEARFGLVVWGSNLHSCSGEGEAMRRGGRLILKMAGDSSCEIPAAISGGTITLPAAVPDGCAYYCGARARLTGTAFTRKGITVDDALKAKDLVGDPLCGKGRPG